MILGSSFSEVYNHPLDNMRFSNCGAILYGTKIRVHGIGEPVILRIAKNHLLLSQYAHPKSSNQETSSDLFRVVDNTDVLGPQLTSSVTQNSGMPEFSTDQGQLQISSLSHHDDVGAIIHRTLRADGTMTTSTITRIPKLSSLENCYSTIVPTEDNENYRLVLNMAAQESYSLDQEVDFQLPAIVDRLKSTIPVHVSQTQPLRLTDGTIGGKRRLNDCDDPCPLPLVAWREYRDWHPHT
jgi:hypothetical protein